MNFRKCILSTLAVLAKRRERELFPIEGVEYCPSGYKTDNEPPKSGWLPYTPDIHLTGKDAHYWLRANFKTPAASENEFFVLRVKDGKEHHGLLYLNGKMVQGLDVNHTDAFLDADTEYSAHNYLYLGPTEVSVSYTMSVFSVDRLVERLYYDIKVPFDCSELMAQGSDEYIRITSALAEATRLLDLRDLNSDAFLKSVEETVDLLERSFYSKLCTTAGKPTVSCVGHTHIDVEWLWTRAQTREKIQRSFATAKSLMDEYPEYKFMLSQPELYRYLKEEAPEKYEELRALVREGRWEPEGAMYLEADCNLTSGESLVRQIIHGKRFFKEEFGVESRILFLPDVFGYSAALPQILKKCGVDYFVTAKIGWNDTNRMPHDTFMWEGIDGTEIFTSLITTQDYVREESQKKSFTTYVGHITPTRIKGTWDRFTDKRYCDTVLTTYGYGDGGGGPTKEMLETQRRLARGIPGMPVTRITTLREYLDTHKAEFDDSCRRISEVPRWVGELYLEYHRGTYTSVAKNKKNNRVSEFLLGNAEALSALDVLYCGESRNDEIRELWRLVLHNQFHDIIPGSSIGEVYDNTDLDYKYIKERGEGIVKEKLASLSRRIKTEGGTLLYNPTGFERPAYLHDGEYRELCDTVPPYGWRVVRGESAPARVTASGLTSENDFYVLTLDGQGRIASLYDKCAGREVFARGECGNVLSVFCDNPTNFDAWEIDDYYKLSRREMESDVTVTPITDGTRAGFEVVRKYMKSTVKQKIWLYSYSRRIDFECEIDWRERHQLLKAEFPLNVHASFATYDVQFGHTTRPTHGNTSWDAAKFEVCAHKWADISEKGYGVALLSDSKYGYSTERNKLALTLLKSPTYPYPEADLGEHKFTYSLLPHIGDFRDAGVIEESFALNQPFIATPVQKNGGDLPEEYSFVSADSKNAVITAVKTAESGDGLVVRLYEAHDSRGRVTLTVPAEYKRAFLCDLLENEEREIEMNNGKATLPLSNFEILTVKFK